MPDDYMGRSLTDTDTADYLGRDVAGGADYLGRSLIADWAATTAYAVGAAVELPGGIELRATVAGTSDVAAPTAPGYGETVVDATVTWEQVTTA